MATPGGPVTIAGESVTGYRGLSEEVQELLRKLAIETQTLLPGDAAGYDFSGGVYYIGMGSDAGGLLVAFRGESPLNPNAQKPSDV